MELSHIVLEGKATRRPRLARALSPLTLGLHAWMLVGPGRVDDADEWSFRTWSSRERPLDALGWLTLSPLTRGLHAWVLVGPGRVEAANAWGIRTWSWTERPLDAVIWLERSRH